MSSHPLLKYNTTALLLGFTVADGVLSGIPSVDDLWSQYVNTDMKSTILPFDNQARELPVLRRHTQKDGVSANHSMPKEALLTILRSTVKNAGYTEGFSTHSIPTWPRKPDRL